MKLNSPANTLEWVFFVIGILYLLQWLFLIRESYLFQKLSEKLRAKRGPLPGERPNSHPKVSVIFTARDEEKYLAQGLRSLASQDYPDYEVIAVNDRSQDNTAKIMDDFAQKFPQIKTLTIQKLPAGWLGKNHALHQATQKASGQIFIFTDADVIFEPSAIKKSVGWMLNNNLDHLVLSPKLQSESLLLSALQSYFSLMFLLFTRPSLAGKSKKHYIGAGAFNMIRKKTYDAIGGHKSLRLEVLDDVMLGKLVVQNDSLQAALSGRDLLSLKWYDSTSEMIKGIGKNGFAALRYSLFKLLALIFFTVWLHVLPYLSLFFLKSVGLYSVLTSLLVAHAFFLLVLRKLGHKWWLFLFMSPVAIILCYTHIRSTFLNLKTGKIVWRETSYSLRELKKNKV